MLPGLAPGVVSPAEDLIDGGPRIVEPGRDADAEIQSDQVTADLEGHVDEPPYPPGHRHGVAGRRRVGHDGVLVGAEPPQQLLGPAMSPQPLTELRENVVGLLVAQVLVDVVEAVDVDEQQCPRTGDDGAGQFLGDRPSVQQPGQLVDVRGGRQSTQPFEVTAR